MAYYLNRAEVIGNLTRDPELRQFENGTFIVSLCVATNFEYTDRNTGEKVNKSEYHDVVVVGDFAVTCDNHLKKGSKVFVDGYLQTNSWVGKEDGVKRQKTEIKAKNVIFLDKKEKIELPQEKEGSTF